MYSAKKVRVSCHNYEIHSVPYRIATAIAALLGPIYLYPIVSGICARGIPAGLANKDFANFWTAGKLVLSGHTADLFGPQPLYFRHLTDVFGPDYPWHNWSYPPHYLLFVWPLGFFGYKLAMVVFLVATGVLYAWALRQFAQRACFTVLLASLPLMIFNVWSAQNGFLTAGLALGALALRDRRAVLTGILLGMLTFKPQLGFLFPFLLLAERRWLAIASAVVTTIVLVSLSALVFGLDMWTGYVQQVLPYQTLVMRGLTGSFLAMLPSAYGTLRSWGFSADLALAVHAAISVPAAITTLASFWLVPDPRWRSIILALGTVLVTPYALTYDLGVIAAALGMMVWFAEENGTDTALNQSVFAGAILLPLYMIPLGAVGLPVAPVVLTMAFVLALIRSGFVDRARALVRRKREAEAPSRGAS